ncbi:type II toxin-antitoxin system RelE/ParE family toxin [Raoultibacter phocaeensis]|uniref:type II toxin-antitoxin system RelE/ParE family toxin n=1 Tax=Raoultibacter phocaeensis TaxID=2479841 RepID=UPI00111B5EB5|nr:type II toxin-antitoxin system RelE/ParE family toxin [Raoultibacter phocaeensis]
MPDPVRVVLSPTAANAIRSINSQSDYAKVRKRLRVLPYVPEMGHPYDPIYEAARPPCDVLVTYAGHYGIYYTYDEENGIIAVEYVLNQRTDPNTRFSS